MQNVVEIRKPNILLSAVATFMFWSPAALSESWTETEQKLFAAREQWEMTCEVLHCDNRSETSDSVSDGYGEAIGDLLSAWMEGNAKRQARLVPVEISPATSDEVLDILTFAEGRWVGVTSWGNRDGMGEIEGVAIDLLIEKAENTFIQHTTHYDLDCVSFGSYTRVQRGGIRFGNTVEDGECRGTEIGIRLFDDSTLKWTRFVGEWPVAWGTLMPVSK